MSTPFTHSSEHEPLLAADDSHSYTDEVPDQEAPMTTDEIEEAWIAELARRPWYRRASLYWLGPFLFLLAVIAGFVSSPSTQLSIRIICRDIVRATPPINPSSISFSSEEDICKRPEVLAQVAVTLGRISAIRGIISLMTLAWWTSLSDKYGRVFLLRFSTVITVISCFVHLYAAAPRTFSGTSILYVDGIFRGISAAGLLYNPAVFAYVADCTPAITRSMHMGFAQTAYFMGGIIGPFLGGHITKVTGELTTALWIAVASLALLHTMLVFMPESLQPKARSSPEEIVPEIVHGVVPKSGATLLRVGETIKLSALSMIKPFKVFWPNNVVLSERMPSRYIPSLVLLARTISNLASFGQDSNFYPMTNLIFHWGAYEDGIYLSVMAIISTVTFMVIFPLLQKAYKNRYDVKESSSVGSEESSSLPVGAVPTMAADVDSVSSKLIFKALKMDMSFYVYGLVLASIGYCIFPIFLSVPALAISAIIVVLGSVGSASELSVITTIMPSEHTGMVMGAISVMDSLASTAGVLAYGQLFAKTSKTIPQAYYFLSFSLTITAGLVAMLVWTFFHRAGRKTAGRNEA